MNNLIVLPIIIPLIVGMTGVFIPQRVVLQRWLAILGLSAVACVAASLVQQNYVAGVQTLQLGGWAAPFGITLVADMFASLLVFTAAIVSIACLLYAFSTIGIERETHYFYPFVMVLAAGVNGSFLTGDIFNLFVFFELMLIASYVLLTLGNTKTQLRESIQYVVINVISSTFFVLAIAYLYSITGTLNMAHLSERIATVQQDGLITTVGLLFLLVFSLKSALFLYFWLPGSYSAPPTAIAALFAALLTKVGMYALIRTFTLIFYQQQGITHTLIIWLAAATMVLGAIGALSSWNIKTILVYNVIITVGFIMFGLGVATASSLQGTLFYIMHDMIIKALLFMLGGTMIHITGTHRLRDISGLIRHHPVLGWLFFITALSLAGVPPLSGFVGKLLILQGGLQQQVYWTVGISLLTSLIVLYSVMKIFLHGFWGETTLSAEEELPTSNAILIPCSLLTTLTIVMGFGAEGIFMYLEPAVELFLNPDLYIQAVLPAQ